MRCLGCLAVLLAAKGGPSLLLRCARGLIPHYLTRPGPPSACYGGWIRVTSGMIRRKYSGYRESRRESRQLVLCAGIHGRRRRPLSLRVCGVAQPTGSVVPQVGLEPTTDGYISSLRGLYLLAALVILDALAHLPALPLVPALPTLPATPALPLLSAADDGSRHFHVDGNVGDHEHSSSCLGTTDPSHVGGPR